MADTRTGWLAELKPGDKVIVQGRYAPSIRTVDRITPLGRIVAGMDTYNPNGTGRGSTYNSLGEATPEALAHISLVKRQRHLSNLARGVRAPSIYGYSALDGDPEPAIAALEAYLRACNPKEPT